MSIIATAVKHLIAAGVTGDALVAAIAEMEADQAQRDPAAEKRRAWDRDRKRRNREAASGGIPVDRVESAENADPPIPDKETPQTPKEINPTPVSVRRAREAPDLPEGATAEQWFDFAEMRRKIRKPMTANAEKLVLKKLWHFAEAGYPPGEILEQSTLNCWQDIFEPKDQSHGRLSPQRPTSLRGTRPNPALDMWRQANASIQAEGFEPDPARDFRAWPALPPEQSG